MVGLELISHVFSLTDQVFASGVALLVHIHLEHYRLPVFSAFDFGPIQQSPPRSTLCALACIL